jgi:hypothetical protein
MTDIQVKKKGKTVGRPSRIEKYLTSEINKPRIIEAIRTASYRISTELMLFGEVSDQRIKEMAENVYNEVKND